MPSFFDLQRYAATGIASPDMTAFDKMRALAAFGGGKTQTLTGIPPLSFPSDGTPLISLSMIGNGQQTGTPSPDNIIMPTFCGKLVDTDWTIPITCAGQTVPVYLGQTQTVRNVYKYQITGQETITKYTSYSAQNCFFVSMDKNILDSTIPTLADRYITTTALRTFIYTDNCVQIVGYVCRIHDGRFSEVDGTGGIREYLQQQYAAGTPVTIWYVLATSTTGIVNEPLAKIGDYADELSSTNAGVTIPTVKGQNTLTVETELQPSEMTITYKG